MARFLIIDDHPLFREALQSAIRTAYPDSEIVESASIEKALEILNSSNPFDLALLDLKIPGISGFEGLIEIRTSHPSLPIVVVSGHENTQIIKAVLSYGSAGFIPKSIKKDALTTAIKAVMDGEISVPHGFRETQLEPNNETASRSKVIEKLASLTPQQMRVLKMLRDGLLNKQIAYELQVGETTVKAHVSEVLRKLGVNNRTQAALEMSKLKSDEFEELNGRFDIAG